VLLWKGTITFKQNFLVVKIPKVIFRNVTSLWHSNLFHFEVA